MSTNSSSNRPDIELALDVRSYECVVVLVNPEAPQGYPDSWIQVQSKEGLAAVVPDSVVVIDRIDVLPRTLAAIGANRPRLIAMAPRGVEQEKAMRRMLVAIHPWSEVWTLSSSFGKLLVTKDAVGEAYDRDLVRDERPIAEA